MKIHSATPAYPIWDDYICEESGVPRAREGGKERSRPPGRRGGELSESAQEMRRESASRYPEEGGWAPIPRRAARQAQWAHAHAARSVGSPYDEGEPDPGTRSRGAERWSAGRAPGRDPRRRTHVGGAASRAPAERREIGGAEDRAGPADPEGVGRGAGRAAGRDPPAAAPRARGAERRLAGPRAGPRRPTIQTCRRHSSADLHSRSLRPP